MSDINRTLDTSVGLCSLVSSQQRSLFGLSDAVYSAARDPFVSVFEQTGPAFVVQANRGGGVLFLLRCFGVQFFDITLWVNTQRGFFLESSTAWLSHIRDASLLRVIEFFSFFVRTASFAFLKCVKAFR